MSSRYLIVADPAASLNPVFDLGVYVSRELLERGIDVDYLDLLAHDPSLPTETYLETLPVRRILEADAARDELRQRGHPGAFVWPAG